MVSRTNGRKEERGSKVSHYTQEIWKKYGRARPNLLCKKGTGETYVNFVPQPRKIKRKSRGGN